MVDRNLCNWKQPHDSFTENESKVLLTKFAAKANFARKMLLNLRMMWLGQHCMWNDVDQVLNLHDSLHSKEATIIEGNCSVFASKESTFNTSKLFFSTEKKNMFYMCNFGLCQMHFLSRILLTYFWSKDCAVAYDCANSDPCCIYCDYHVRKWWDLINCRIS